MMYLLEKVKKLLKSSQEYIVFIMKAWLICLNTPRIYHGRKNTKRNFGHFFPDIENSLKRWCSIIDLGQWSWREIGKQNTLNTSKQKHFVSGSELKEEHVYKCSTKRVLKIVSVHLWSHDLKKELSEVAKKSSNDGKWMISLGENSRTQFWKNKN